MLDECTDAVSADVERGLYEALHREGITCITISKRRALGLEAFHAQRLKLGEPTLSGWDIRDIADDAGED